MGRGIVNVSLGGIVESLVGAAVSVGVGIGMDSEIGGVVSNEGDVGNDDDDHGNKWEGVFSPKDLAKSASKFVKTSRRDELDAVLITLDLSFSFFSFNDLEEFFEVGFFDKRSRNSLSS